MKTPRQKPSLERWTRFEQQGRLSSHWTTALTDQWFLALIVLLTAVHWILSSLLPLSEDELYYLAWAKNLSLSYFDHPPMVALLIRASTFIFGEGPFGVRFFAAPIMSIVVFCIGLTVKNRRLITLALFTPLFFWMSMVITPDTPLLLFWTLYFLWSTQLATRFSEWGDDPVSRVYHYSPVSTGVWALGGVLLGLGLLSKYTMFLAPVCLLCNFFSVRLAAWWKGFLVHLAIAVVMLVPVWVFNAQHNFAPLLFQWHHGLSSDTPAFRFFGEYVVAQWLLVGALPLILAVWQFLRIKEIFDSRPMRISFFFFTIPFYFFLFSAMRHKTEGNWGVMAYASFWVLAQMLFDYSSFRRESLVVFWISFLPCYLLTLLIGIHLVAALKWVPPARDRIYRVGAQGKVFRSIAKSTAVAPVFATTYQNTAQLLYAGARAFQLPGVGRQSHFTLTPTTPCEFDSVYVLMEDPNPPSLSCFTKSQMAHTYDVNVRGTLVGRLYLAIYSR